MKARLGPFGLDPEVILAVGESDMAKRIDPKLQAWIEARKRHHLTHAQVQMARELGLDPKGLGKIDNHRAEPWKLPLPQFIESLYLKRFGRPPAEPVRSIEEIAAARRASKDRQREQRATARPAADTPKPVGSSPRFPNRKISETLLDFAEPALVQLPPETPIKTYRQMMQIAITVWNAGSMRFPIWQKQSSKDYALEWDRLMQRAEPQTRAFFEGMMRRRTSEPFNTDQRGVGEWSVVATGSKGEFNFRCEARLPDDPSEAEAAPP